MTSRIMHWFTTRQGRNVMSALAVVVSGGVSMATYLPHNAFITNYRDFLALRKNGERVRVPERLKELFDETLLDTGIDEYHRLLAKPFMVFGFDSYRIGSLSFVRGAYIGLPINYTYKDQSSINKAEIFINNEPVNWNRDDAKLLLDSLILSDDAKKYAIAREVMLANNYLVMFKSLFSGGILAATFNVAAQFNNGSKLFEKPRGVRFVMYALNGLFWWGIWCLQNDTLLRYYENSVDEEIAQFGENYIRGAVEFWDKAAMRNKALRTLLGPEGIRMYKLDGDEISFFRNKHVPVSSQRNFFQKKLKEKLAEKENVKIEEIPATTGQENVL